MRKIPFVLGVMLAITWSRSMPRVCGSMSTNTGSKPHCSTEAMSDTQVSVGTMISPAPADSRSAAIVIRFADEPELTKTQCFTPSHSAHSRSKAATWADCVRIGSSCSRNRMTASRSPREMLLRISGQGPTEGGVASLFIVVVPVLDQQRAPSVLPQKRPLVGGEDLLRFVEADHLDRGAHQPQRLGVVADVLMLRMERTL